MLIDIIFVVLMISGCIKGLRKGFILGIFSFIALIAGIAAALKLSAVSATKLSENINVPQKFLPVLSFIVVFIIVVVLVNFGGRLLQKTFQTLMLGGIDKLAGAILFMLLYAIIYSVFLFYAVQLNFLKPAAVGSSRFYSYVQPMAPGIMKMIGNIIPVFKNVFGELSHFFESTSNKLTR